MINCYSRRYWGRGGNLLLLLVGGIHVGRRSIITLFCFLDPLFSWLLMFIKFKTDLLKVCTRFTACRKLEISFPFFTKEHLPSSVPTYKPFAASLTEYNIAFGPVICKHGTTASSLVIPSNTNRSITHLFSIKSLVRSEVILPIDASALAISTFAVSTSFWFFLALNWSYTARTSTLNPLDSETPDESPTLSPHLSLISSSSRIVLSSMGPHTFTAKSLSVISKSLRNTFFWNWRILRLFIIYSE